MKLDDNLSTLIENLSTLDVNLSTFWIYLLFSKFLHPLLKFIFQEQKRTPGKGEPIDKFLNEKKQWIHQ